MKNKNKGLIIATVALLTMAVLLPVYAQTQSGVMQQDRDQDCEPQGSATRSYGEDSQNPEDELSTTEATQEQTQIREKSGECICENEDCEEFQYQHQYQYQNGQEED